MKPAKSAAQADPTRHHRLAGDVYEAIFAQLMSLRIAPGSRITVDNLGKEFNVSHTPIAKRLAGWKARAWS